MKFLNPIPITESVFVSSNVAEADHAEYNAATTYGMGDRVIVAADHTIYESAQGANVGNPVSDGDWWLNAGATNRWKMFDQGVGTRTENAASIEVVLTPGLCNSLALLDIAASRVTVTVEADGAVIYHREFPISDSAPVGDWFDYFFEPIQSQSNLIVNDMPVYSGGSVTITIDAPVTARCGTLAIGRLIDVGKTRAGARVGVIDYSRKTTDEWGNTSVVAGPYARRVEVDVVIDTARIDYIVERFAEARATPCVWITDQSGTRASLTVYGFYKDFGVVVSYPNISETSLTIEGLV